MKSKFLILIVISISLLSGCGKSDYEKAQDSFGNRLRTGNFSGMSDLEKDAANDYFKWVSKQ